MFTGCLYFESLPTVLLFNLSSLIHRIKNKNNAFPKTKAVQSTYSESTPSADTEGSYGSGCEHGSNVRPSGKAPLPSRSCAVSGHRPHSEAPGVRGADDLVCAGTKPQAYL